MEYIFKRLSRGNGEGGIALRIEEAARELGRPVFFAVGVVIVVFATLFTLQGVEGKLFQPMAVAIVLAMLASVLVALTLVPALATYIFRHPVKARISPFVFPFEWSCRWLLRGALRVRWLVLMTALSLLAGALWLAPRLGTEFDPELEEGAMKIRVTLAPSSSLDTAWPSRKRSNPCS
jgi:cobalt-zinc-cadmium resistance protein CzcA